MQRIVIAIIGVLGLLGLYLATSVSVDPSFEYAESKAFYNGSAGYSVIYDRNETVQSITVELSMDLIESAPVDPSSGDQNIRLEFPSTVKENTFFDHLDIGYHPGGHPPGPYLVPHFDIHMYGIDEEAQLAIDCADRVVIAGDLLPDHHIATQPGLPPEGECVPEMGHHGIDLRSPELNPDAPQPFTKTMILGYYEGELTFLEPMITKAFLMERKGFTLDIVWPGQLPRETRYPTQFYANFNESTGFFELTFTNFEMMP